MIKLNTKKLKKQLAILTKVVERKTTIPVLSNLLIETIGGKDIRITGTDLDLTYQCILQDVGDSETPDYFIAPAHLLAKIIGSTLSETVEFAVGKNGHNMITTGPALWDVPQFARDAFPTLVSFPTGIPEVVLPADKVKRAIKCSRFSTTKEYSRFTLSCAKTLYDDALQMVSTNGHCLTMYKERLSKKKKNEQHEPILMQSNVMDLLAKMSGESVNIYRHDGRHIWYEMEQGRICVRESSGKFPNWEMVWPRGNDKQVIFQTEDLLRACQQVMFSQGADRITPSLRMRLSKSTMTIEATMGRDRDGQYSCVLPCDSTDGGEIGFNPFYLVDYLKVIGKGEMKMEWKDSNAQTLFVATQDADYDFQYVVMPLRILKTNLSFRGPKMK